MAFQFKTQHIGGSQFLTDSFQRGLAHWNRERLQPALPTVNWQRDLERDVRMLRLEGAFIEELRDEVGGEAARAPQDADAFIAWFENLREIGPGQGDPLFPWLAEEADDAELRWFFEQEAAGEAGFDDLVAYTELPLRELSRVSAPVSGTAMLSQFFDGPRRAVALDILGRRTHDQLNRHQRACDRATRWWRSTAKSHIRAVGHKIRELIVELHFELYILIALLEFLEVWP